MLGRGKPHMAVKKLHFWRGLAAEVARSGGLSAGALSSSIHGSERGALPGKGKQGSSCITEASPRGAI